MIKTIIRDEDLAHALARQQRFVDAQTDGIGVDLATGPDRTVVHLHQFPPVTIDPAALAEAERLEAEEQLAQHRRVVAAELDILRREHGVLTRRLRMAQATLRP